MEAIVNARKEANKVRKMTRNQDAATEERRLAAEERKMALEERKVGMEERSKLLKWKKRDGICDVDESNKHKRTIELDDDEEEA